jgi:hypothetical protein
VYEATLKSDSDDMSIQLFVKALAVRTLILNDPLNDVVIIRVATFSDPCQNIKLFLISCTSDII